MPEVTAGNRKLKSENVYLAEKQIIANWSFETRILTVNNTSAQHKVNVKNGMNKPGVSHCS